MRQKLISLTVILLLGLFSNKVVAQVNVKIDRLPLKEALVEVEKQSGYSFFYSNMLPNQDAVVSVRATGSSIESVMDELLKGLGIKYEVKPDKQIRKNSYSQRNLQYTASKSCFRNCRRCFRTSCNWCRSPD